MTMQQRQRLILGVLVLIAMALVGWVMLHRAPAKAAAPPAIPVTAVRAVSEDMPLSLSALGAAQAWTSDTIFAQATGRLLSVDFVEGADVKAGQLLAQVDPRPYRAVLTEAEGTLKRDQALLAEARMDLVRFQHLVAESAIARQIAEDQAHLVVQDEGTVLLDQGEVAAAQVNLGYCRITAPISGRVGVRLVDPGNLVSASGSVASTPNTAAATSSATPTGGASASGSATASTVGVPSSSGSGIVVLNQIQPIAVTFSLTEGDFQRLLSVSNGFSRPLAVRAYGQETGDLVDSGVVSIADNRVDPATGTVELKARFPNTGNRLWPGQFVNVKLVLQVLNRATVIPSAAVNRGPNGSFAFVVGPDRHVVVRPLVVSAREGANAVVQSGVRAGELVVTDGQMTLKSGSLVSFTEK